MNYSVFKNELRNLFAYERDLNRLDQKIEDLLYEMTGVKGISYSKIPSTVNPELSEERRLELIEEMDVLVTEKKRLQLNITHIYATLSLLNEKDRKAMIDLVAKRIKSEEVAFNNGYSKSGIWKRIKKEIEKL